MSQKLNKIVTIDLYKWGYFFILYFIDTHLRLCAAKRISKKILDEVVNAFLSSCPCAGYKIPNEIIVDNGEEFTGEKIKEMCSFLNIKINTTASHSPCSNSLCEINHSVVDNMLDKLQFENSNMPFDDLLAWTCTAKNAMAMFNGYSPYQIVFESNLTLPGSELHPPQH